ncbi:hypothetical protein [Streptomyces sp. NPDC101455]|uniref:hypothetical protein n=1 Tax=Streptomyces sp. NPDC101455 TaxID=3366142 RepID=UPI0037FB023C
MVQTLAAAGDLQRELTYDGLRAAEVKGNKGGRRPAVPAGKAEAVRTAYLEGGSIAALARDHNVSRGAIRTAVADLLPEYTVVDAGTAPPELSVVLDMPGKVADFLRAADLAPVERAVLDQGVTVRRGQGYTLRITAVPAIHRRLLDLCQALSGASAVPAQRKARREYENRANLHAPTTDLGSQSRSATSTRRGLGDAAVDRDLGQRESDHSAIERISISQKGRIMNTLMTEAIRRQPPAGRYRRGPLELPPQSTSPARYPLPSLPDRAPSMADAHGPRMRGCRHGQSVVKLDSTAAG